MIKNPIRLFAVICVAITSAYVMYIRYWLLTTLSGPGWCATALGAGKASSKDGSPIKGLESCVSLLTIQLKTLADNSYIDGLVIALCLLVLMVVVIAGARLDLKVTPTSLDANIDSTSAPRAAQTVADSAQATADVIKDTAP